jgi:hypothetical protein
MQRPVTEEEAPGGVVHGEEEEDAEAVEGAANRVLPQIR